VDVQRVLHSLNVDLRLCAHLLVLTWQIPVSRVAPIGPVSCCCMSSTAMCGAARQPSCLWSGAHVLLQMLHPVPYLAPVRLLGAFSLHHTRSPAMPAQEHAPSPSQMCRLATAEHNRPQGWGGRAPAHFRLQVRPALRRASPAACRSPAPPARHQGPPASRPPPRRAPPASLPRRRRAQRAHLPPRRRPPPAPTRRLQRPGTAGSGPRARAQTPRRRSRQCRRGPGRRAPGARRLRARPAARGAATPAARAPAQSRPRPPPAAPARATAAEVPSFAAASLPAPKSGRPAGSRTLCALHAAGPPCAPASLHGTPRDPARLRASSPAL